MNKVGHNLLLLEVRKDEHGREISARVSMLWCKKCYIPHEGAEAPKFLPWTTSNYVLDTYSERSPPFQLTAKDVCMELDNYRIKPTTITKQKISRGFRSRKECGTILYQLG